MKPLKVTSNSPIFNYESEEKTPLKEENLDLLKVSALLRYKRKNRSNEIIVSPSIKGPRLSFYYFAKFAFDEYDHIKELVKTNYAKTVFYGENGNIKYSTVIYSKENGDIKIVSGSVYEESGDCPIDYILLLKEDGNIPVVCKDLTENNPKEGVGSIVFKVLYPYYKNGGKSFYNKFREYTEEIFGLESKECAIMKPLKVSLNSLLFEDKEKYPIKEENLLVGPEEAKQEENLPAAPEEITKEETSPEEAVEEEEENLLLIAPKEAAVKEEENTSKESAKEEEEANLLVGPEEAAVKEEENLPVGPAEEQPAVVEEEHFNPADQFSKPYAKGDDKAEKQPAPVPGKKVIDKKKEKRQEPVSDKEVTAETHRFLEKSKEFVLIFAGNKTTVESIEVTSITIQTSRDGKLDMKKSKVVFMEHKRKGDSVRKKKSFNGFMKYLDKKWLKFSVLGRINASVSVFNY